MAGAQFQFSIDDADLRELEERLARPRELVPRLGEYLVRSTKDRFSTQTGPDGTPWVPLKQRYARRKKLNKDKILTLRGDLRRYIRYQPDGDAAVVGTNLPYGAIHQFGGTIEQPERQSTVRLRSVAGRVLFAGQRHKRAVEKSVTIPAHDVVIPARPYLGLSDQDGDNLAEIVREWLAGD